MIKGTSCAVGSEIQEFGSNYIGTFNFSSFLSFKNKENIAGSVSAIISYNGGKFYAIQLLVMNNLSHRKGNFQIYINK